MSLLDDIPTIDASCTALTAMLEAMTVPGNEPALIFPGVSAVKFAPLTAGSAADPSNCTNLFAALNMFPCFVTLDPSIAEFAIVPVSFVAVIPTIDASCTAFTAMLEAITLAGKDPALI
jgi:hypothetical protein